MSVIAASTDSQEHARETKDALGLTMPIGFGLPLEATAEKLGAYYETRRQILHATGFLLKPDGTISIAVYSSGAIGRLAPDDVVRLVDFFEKRS